MSALVLCSQPDCGLIQEARSTGDRARGGAAAQGSRMDSRPSHRAEREGAQLISSSVARLRPAGTTSASASSGLLNLQRASSAPYNTSEHLMVDVG